MITTHLTGRPRTPRARINEFASFKPQISFVIEVGTHILSGNVFESRALNELVKARRMSFMKYNPLMLW